MSEGALGCSADTLRGPRLSRFLGEAVGEVLETMFFVENQGPAAGSGPPEELFEARVSFEGGPSGTLRLRVTRRAAQTLAADFFGEDSLEPPGSRVREVVSELANMICGSLLSRVDGEATLRLAASAATSTTGDVIENPGDAIGYRVDLPNGALGVVLAMNGAVT